MQTSLEILSPLQMLDFFYNVTRLIFYNSMPELTLQMRAGPSKAFSCSPTKPWAYSNEAVFARDVLGMFLWKLPLQLVPNPSEKISFINLPASISFGEPKIVFLSCSPILFIRGSSE